MKLFLSLLLASCIFCQSIHELEMEKYKNQVRTGLDILISDKIDLIKRKNIGLVTNQTGVDRNGKSNYKILKKLDNVQLKAIFSPEHGFFGDVSAGIIVDDQKVDDFPTIYSLYGKTRKPTPDMLEGLDVIIYDIQDVGTRFYTYISTLGLVMEAAGEAGIPIIVLDRPNPLGGEKIEGPVLDMNFKSFVGMYPIPIRYGLTVGELAKMIIGEKWISVIPDLTVIEMKGWKRNMHYDETGLPWINPSPNIPDLETAFLYPGMALLEAILIVSEGRGTDNPFKWIGAPWIDDEALSQRMNEINLPGIVFEPVSFTPLSIPGISESPKFINEECQGIQCTITDYKTFKPVITGLYLIVALNAMYQMKNIEGVLKSNSQYLTKLFGDSMIFEIFFYHNPDAYYGRTYKRLLKNYENTMKEYLLYD